MTYIIGVCIFEFNEAITLALATLLAVEKRDSHNVVRHYLEMLPDLLLASSFSSSTFILLIPFAPSAVSSEPSSLLSVLSEAPSKASEAFLLFFLFLFFLPSVFGPSLSPDSVVFVAASGVSEVVVAGSSFIGFSTELEEISLVGSLFSSSIVGLKCVHQYLSRATLARHTVSTTD
ncbi:hypothetical protein E2C01_013290 [Portunus trituberculatus]|uniref:Uncharacterized protein n=1 Tax=Portunus trituberculatus TaxID=210409 RepID=A0A5B7DGP3_PORTR|nr:hypothetical protein [Portunus trituberculatus]